MGSGTTRVVLLSAGLPCGARGKVGPSNSLRALCALRSNNSGQLEAEARFACPPCRCAPRHPRGARAHAGFALFAPLCACASTGDGASTGCTMRCLASPTDLLRMHSHKCKCGTAQAMINGRTLRLALSGCRVPPGPLPVTEWVSVCPRCDRGLLQSTAGTPLPFLASDGVMRTALDYLEPGRPLPTPFGFARFAASSSALLSAFALFEEDDPTTVSVEDLGRKFADSPTPDVALSFSEAVCDWGRGRRVWANLLRHNGREELATTLVAWFKEALDSNDVERAIKQGIAIKGLSVESRAKLSQASRPKLSH